jgi:hypothetical protein
MPLFEANYEVRHTLFKANGFRTQLTVLSFLLLNSPVPDGLSPRDAAPDSEEGSRGVFRNQDTLAHLEQCCDSNELHL